MTDKPPYRRLNAVADAWEQLTGILREIASNILATQGDVAASSHEISRLRRTGVAVSVFVAVLVLAFVLGVGSFSLSHMREAERHRIRQEALWRALDSEIRRLADAERTEARLSREALQKLASDVSAVRKSVEVKRRSRRK